jgi:hypothetical protein
MIFEPSTIPVLFFDEPDALFGNRTDVKVTIATPTSRSAICSSVWRLTTASQSS